MLQTLMHLAVSFFKVGVLSFGGGYTLIPLIEREVVNIHAWLSHDEFMNILGASQAIPGAISVKFATYVGYQEAGLIGVIVALTSSFLAPVVLILSLFNLLKRSSNIAGSDKFLLSIRSATWGLIIGFGLQAMLKTSFEYKNVLVGLAAMVALVVFKVSPAVIIIIAGLVGFLLYR